MKWAHDPSKEEMEALSKMILEQSKDGKFYLVTEESGSVLLAPQQFIEKCNQRMISKARDEIEEFFVGTTKKTNQERTEGPQVVPKMPRLKRKEKNAPQLKPIFKPQPVQRDQRDQRDQPAHPAQPERPSNRN